MESHTGDNINRRVWLVVLVNFLLGFATQGSNLFVPLLGAQLGASDSQVGLVGAVYGAAFLLSSLVSGWKSDQTGRLLFVRRGLLASSAAFAAQLLAGNVALLMLMRGMVGFALGIATAAAIAYAFECGIDMGKFSSYGSLGWIFGAMAAALVEDIYLLFWISFVVCLAAFIASLFFQETTALRRSLSPKLFQVLRRNYRIYFAVFLRHLGATAVWVILPLYLSSLGVSKFWIGLLWGVNFAVQFVVMRYLEHYSEYKVFAFGQALSFFVFVVFAYVTGKLPLVLVMALLGVAWSCLYVGALLIVLRSGEERGTSSGIFQSTLNLCNALGPLLGGLIAEGFGYRSVLFFAAALSVAGMFIAIPAKSKEPGLDIKS
ncbi:putative transporter [Pelotomaculum sp. FP]|uniref:MFS transporter n=1 Tax=Pelotomaculum sp. FP TaxID=261474 RepID=UPI0011017E6D|nr:MFS transporter [Pelotomaculum sp. FP]TEB16339.1 putative transporter [Pelotomaculum sp. FP]